jgi:hypothetical protein
MKMLFKKKPAPAIESPSTPDSSVPTLNAEELIHDALTLEDLSRRASELTRLLKRVEKTEGEATNELARAQRRYSAGDRGLVDPREVKQWLDSVTAQAVDVQSKLLGVEAERRALENKFIDNPDCVARMQVQLAVLEVDQEALQATYEQLVVKQIAKLPYDIDALESAKNAVNACGEQIHQTEMAINIVETAIRNHRAQQEWINKKPAIMDLISARQAHIEKAVRIDEEIIGALGGFCIWPKEDWNAIQARAEHARKTLEGV